jgi:hypothetical protein
MSAVLTRGGWPGSNEKATLSPYGAGDGAVLGNDNIRKDDHVSVLENVNDFR